MKRFKLVFSVLLSLALLLSLPVSQVFAATEDTVTVTATPAFISCSNAPGTWTLNDIVGDGVSPKGTIAPDTMYYSNPLGDGTAPSATVVDGECRFTLTNTSTVTTDVFITVGDFSGGSANMTNSNDGSNGASSFGAHSYCTGMTLASWVVCKASGSAVTKEDLAPTTDIKWGLGIETQTGAWAGGTSSTATITISLVLA